MFDNLSQRLTDSVRKIFGKGILDEKIINETLDEIFNILIDADVALPVAQNFIDHIRTQALGQKVLTGLKPAEALIKIVYDEMVALLGTTQAELNLRAKPPVRIMIVGLQGSGKTTTTAKLALWLKNQKKSALLCSTDVYRPAAIQQLKTLAEQHDIAFFPSDLQQKPVDIANAAIDAAARQFVDVVIIDTAGRLHVDKDMMSEVRNLHEAVQPTETLFVVDAMTGQDAVNSAKAFDQALPITGIILTKTDGDARGGAALSVREITGKPIKFIGVGEKVEALEVFHPDRIASRILGMGDVLSLIEDVQRKVDQKEAEKLSKKFKKGEFDLDDFLTQLAQMRQMGGMGALMSKIPGLSGMGLPNPQQIDDKLFVQMEAIIRSMTRQERRFTHLINGSRKRRIAMGSGTHIQDVNRLLKQFTRMQKTMKKLKGMNPMKMLGGLKGLKGSFPPGLF